MTAELYAELMLANRELNAEIKVLRNKLYGHHKLSKCCSAILVQYRGTNEEWCPDCKAYSPWKLKRGQKALFNNDVGE